MNGILNLGKEYQGTPSDGINAIYEERDIYFLSQLPSVNYFS